MIAIIEGGSTKSDWILLSGEKKLPFHTKGINPYFHSVEEVIESIKENEELCSFRDEISQVFFYGAGCSASHLNEIVEKGFQSVFKNAQISVDHDLTACAYSTYTGKPGISCIIGTGSNSCYFDGVNLTEQVPALGYILGDEGSGSYFGKKLLADFLYGKLPKPMAQKLELLGWTKDLIVEKVYREPNANVFLASFMPFIAGFRDNDYVKNMIREGFEHFVRNHVLCFENAKEVPVHFVGSIADMFIHELKQTLSAYDIKIGVVIRKPIHGLALFHANQLVNA
jgi:glucosamine kinase